MPVPAPKIAQAFAERGVVLRNGKLSSVAEPGLGFKTPVIESVRTVSVRDQAMTMKLETYSYDQQPATMVVSVTYRIPVDRVADLYSEYGTLTNLQARAQALATNTNLVNLIAVEKWNGALPATQVPGSALPFIGVK